MNELTTLEITDELNETPEVFEAKEFKKRAVSGSISYTIRSIFLFGIGFVTSAFLAAYLTSADFGVYGIVTQLIGILQFFSSIGLGPTLIQKKTEPTVAEYRAVFTVQQIISWIVVVIIGAIALSGLVTPKLGEAGLWVLFAFAISFPLDSLRIIPAIILERKLDFSKLVIPSIFEQIVYNLVLLLGVVVFKEGVKSYAYAIVIRGMVGVAIMYAVQGWPFGFNFDKEIIKRALSTGSKFQISDLLARIKDNIFYLCLAFFLPIQEFGYITFSKSWSMMPYNLSVQNVIAITFPAYSRLQHNKNLLKRAIEKTVYFISISIIPVLTGMCLFIGPITQVIAKYQKWQPALLTFILFTLSIGWAAISTPLTNTLNAIGEINQTVKLMVMWTILTWIVTPVSVWLWGFNGVAISAFLISFTSMIPIMLVKKSVPVEIFPQVKDALFAALAMVVVGFMTMKFITTLPILILSMGLTGLAYFIALLLVGRQKLFIEIKSLKS